MRNLLAIACLVACHVILGCGPTGVPEPSSAELDVLPEDYANARAIFKTKLTRHGPAPPGPTAVHYSLLRRPSDVDEVEFPSGSLRLVGWLKRPDGDGQRFPAVVFLHGGWGFDENDWGHSAAFRDAGFLVLSPMLRGENGCPGDFTMFYDEVDDVVAAIDYLATRDDVDSNRIFLAGYSAGGTLTMMAAMVSDRIRAAAVLDGSPDRRTFVQGREEEVPFDLMDAEELHMRSPIDFPAKFNCPIKFYCSMDPGGFIDETQQLVESAKGLNRDAELVELAGDHGSFREPATELATGFFLSFTEATP